MNIILYHQDNCGQCKMAEMVLKNIEYESCKDMKEMEKQGIRTTPVLSVDGNLYFGAKAIKDWVESRK